MVGRYRAHRPSRHGRRSHHGGGPPDPKNEGRWLGLICGVIILYAWDHSSARPERGSAGASSEAVSAGPETATTIDPAASAKGTPSVEIGQATDEVDPQSSADSTAQTGSADTTDVEPAAYESSEGCTVNYYRASSSDCVHRPEAAATAPTGASAQCGDGTYSFSEHRRGTCSHHGGVQEWL